MTLTWTDGTLQSKTNLLTGSWEDVPLATSPYTTSDSVLPAKFYRLRCP
jgi:hypothetical protein